MIVITAPTSNIGSQVLASVLDAGEPVRVIARDPARLTDRVRDQADVVQGSHREATVVDRAFEGASEVFWLVPADPRAESIEDAYVGFARPGCEALARHGVQRVVGVSALGRGTPHAASAGHVTATLAMDDMIVGTGVSYRALTMPSFMDNVLRQVAPIKNQGVFFGINSPDRKSPTCATRDIAAAASRLLLDRSWSGNGHVAVLGPEDLSYNDMAEIISDVLDKAVRYQQIPVETFKARLLENGMSQAIAQSLVDMALAKDQGLDNAEPRNAESTTPTSFRQWCEEVLKPRVLDAEATAAAGTGS
jgi:uncharacterized protein YbjT (DUF2867 family)